MLEKVAIFLIAFATFAQAQQMPNCNPDTIEWLPHPTDCTKYIICFHGVPNVMSCAPDLHFNRFTTQCMLPEDAYCDWDSRCPLVDDPHNPVFVPDEVDCQKYFLCNNGNLEERRCSIGLWWDVVNEWCAGPYDVTCYNSTTITPAPPTTTTIVPPPTTTTTTASPSTTTTGPNQGPNTAICGEQRELYDGQRYIKTMCLVRSATGYDNARVQCHNNRMNLFIIDDGTVQRLFFNETMDILHTVSPRGHVWINGRRNVNTNVWTVQHSDDSIRGSLYSGLDWVQTGNIDGQTSGACLLYSGQHSNRYQPLGAACNTNGWFMCEHGAQFLAPTTTTVAATTTTTTTLPVTTTTPVQPPNTAACTNQVDLFDGQRYLKTYCLIRTATNYDNARLQCHNHRMNLFVIDTTLIQTLFFNTTMSLLFTSFPRGHVWINGRNNTSTNGWIVQNSDGTLRGPLYNNMDWVRTQSINGQTNGPCLMSSGQHGTHYQALGNACNTNGWFVCEHGVQFSTPPPTTTPPVTTTTPPLITTTMATTTSEPPNVAACFRSFDIFNGPFYIKTMCIINTGVNYDSARATCNTNRMNLFVIDDDVIHVLFFNSSMQNLHPTWPNGHFWINGRRNETSNAWTVQHPDDTARGLLYPNVDWVRTPTINGETNGPCLLYTSQRSDRFQPMGNACNLNSWFICEHRDQSTTPDPTATPIPTPSSFLT